ncbi:heme d1 biosynthesis radical SAM protein NirJ2 [Spirochaetia bacterium]|nr:heme d1 biosynthesis radical SAM protein NirJ2 [Spirochaetia bacterium]
MDTPFVFRIFEEYRDMGGQDLIISGGEPMLHSSFLEIVDKAAFYGFRINIFTNLTLLTNGMEMSLKTLNLKIVSASLYSVAPSVHDAITKLPGSCEKTKAALIRLSQVGVPVFICCPIMKQNKDSYPGVIQWAKSIDASFSYDPWIMARSDRTIDNLENRLTEDEALRVLETVLENDPGAWDKERFYPGYKNIDDVLPCVQNACSHSVYVNAAGLVLPSPAWNCVLGDLHIQTLSDIWQNSSAIKRLHTISLKDFPKCENCADIQFCGMSLEGNANENAKGDPLRIPPHICELARRTRLIVHNWHTKRAAYARNQ